MRNFLRYWALQGLQQLSVLLQQLSVSLLQQLSVSFVTTTISFFCYNNYHFLYGQTMPV